MLYIRLFFLDSGIVLFDGIGTQDIIGLVKITDISNNSYITLDK